MDSCRLLQQQWRDALADLVRSSNAALLVSSPYLTQQGAGFLASSLSERQQEAIRLTVVTDLSPLNVCQGSSDPMACRSLCGCSQEMVLFHLPRLHAKVYVADEKRAIVTSGNLTAGGLYQNYEYGVDITDPAAVRIVRHDLSSYAQLGALVTEEQLDAYCQVASEVRAAFRRRVADASRTAKRRFAGALRAAEDELIRLRLAGGATHTVFARTILYLLQRRGPLETVQMHPLIQSIHPDLCDDTVDRVIDGKHFGRKWKHAVRTAQQQLKKRGLIELVRGKWLLVSGNMRHEEVIRATRQEM